MSFPDIAAPGLAPSGGSLLDRDPDLRRPLGVLLDDSGITHWLSAHLGRSVDVRRRYLRYKPGSSCVVAAEMTSPAGTEDLVLVGYAASSLVKAEKTISRANRGSVLAVDRRRRLLVTTAAADRDLPGLGLLADPERRARVTRRLLRLDTTPDRDLLDLTTLSYKPHRRWVGLLRCDDGFSFILRCYPPRRFAESMTGLGGVGSAPVSTQQIVGTHSRLGLAALEYLPGRTLDTEHDVRLLNRAGRTLAHLHAHPTDLRLLRPDHQAQEVRRTADLVRHLMPDLTARIDGVARAAVRRLSETRSPTATEAATLHGDFSMDQVVADPGGIALIDFDRARRGPAEVDLGSLAAATLLNGHGSAAHVLAEVERGYTDLRAVPEASAIATQTAVQLLKRAAEPFRDCRPDWRVDIQRVVDMAAAVLETVPDETRSRT